MKLRPYQLQTVQALLHDFKNSFKHMMVLPTGSGKTFIFCELIKALNKKTLIVSHSIEILSQTKESLKKVLGNHPHEVMSIQKAHRRIPYLKSLGFEFLIIDECHRGAAFSYLTLISELGFGVDKHLLGCTATPFRGDGRSIIEIFGEPCATFTLLQLINEGFLSDFRGYRIKTEVSLEGIPVVNGDFNLKKLDQVVNVSNRNELIVSSYERLSMNKKALAFCTTVKHAEQLRDCFNKRGIASEMIEGNTRDEIRRMFITQFKEGRISVITSCLALTEGFDEPSIETLILARPTMSRTLYLQMIGRGSRKNEGKEFCQVLEFTDNEFDVCSLESISHPGFNFPMQEGELFTEFLERLSREEPHLNQEGGTLVARKIDFFKKSIYEREATPWQLSILKGHNIHWSGFLSEFEANNLIQENHIYD